VCSRQGIHPESNWQLPTRATLPPSQSNHSLCLLRASLVEPAQSCDQRGRLTQVWFSMEDSSEAQRLLLRLNDYARDPGGISDSFREDLMRDALNYLSSFSSTSASSPLHWFCNIAPRVVAECATFLLRLHAYESEQVPVWKSQCVKVLHTCSQCCASYQDRKVASRRS